MSKSIVDRFSERKAQRDDDDEEYDEDGELNEDLENKINSAETFVVLKFLDSDEKVLQLFHAMGFKGDKKEIEDELGEWCINYWGETPEPQTVKRNEIPKDADIDEAGPIVIVINGRLFPGRSFGFVRGYDTAYIPEDLYEDLF